MVVKMEVKSVWKVISTQSLVLQFFFGSCFAAFSQQLQSEQAEEVYDTAGSWTVYHGFGTGENVKFTERGTITIRSSKNNIAFHSNSDAVDLAFKQALQDAVAKGDVYRVRVASSTDDQGPPWVTGFMPACLLYESHLSDTLSLHLSPQGQVISLGVHVTSLAQCNHGNGGGAPLPSADDLNFFNSSVHVLHTKPGPVPETQVYLEKLAQEKAQKERGDQGDNRSFLAKYWMYIVPVVLFMMISGAANPEQQGGGGGGGR